MRTAASVLAIFFAVAFVVYAHDTLLLLFAGALLAIVFRALAAPLARVLRIPFGFALTVTIVVLLALVGAAFAWRGAAFAAQFAALAKTLPAAISTLSLRLGLGSQTWLQRLNALDATAVSRVVTGAGWVLSSVVASITSLAVVVFTGACLAAEPQTYLGAMVRLVPPPRRARVATVFAELGAVLRSWLIARLISMIAVGAFVTFGLTLLRLPFAETFGLLAGILAFIPNIGSIGSALPAIVLALTIDVRTALVVIALYWLAHFVDDFVVLPLAERRIVHLPPALTVTMQLLLVVPAGILGIMLAAPLAASAIVLVKRLYVEDVVEADRRGAGGERVALESATTDVAHPLERSGAPFSPVSTD